MKIKWKNLTIYLVALCFVAATVATLTIGIAVLFGLIAVVLFIIALFVDFEPH